MIGLNLVYAVGGIVFAVFALLSARDRRFANAAFYALITLSFLFGNRLGDVANGVLVLALVFMAFAAGPLMGAMAGLMPSHRDVAVFHFSYHALADLARALLGGLWHIAMLPQQALLALDAQARTAWRMAISRRHLLQWTTAASAQARMKADLASVVRRHAIEPVAACALLGTLLATSTSSPLLAAALCVLWASSPLWIWWSGRVRPVDAEALLASRASESIVDELWGTSAAIAPTRPEVYGDAESRV